MSTPRPSWWTAVAVVWRKELRDGVRDRRSLLSALLYPLIGPLISALMFSFFADSQREAASEPVPIVGQQHAPELVSWLVEHGVEVVDAPEDPHEAVRSGEVSLVVVIPEGFGEAMAVAKTVRVDLIMDGSRNDARAAVGRTQQLFERYSGELASLRLLARGVDPQIVRPLQLAEVDVASEAERAASLFSFVPMFVLLAAFIGGMQIAVDATAGERERGSLEPLLLNPVPRSALVVGKWLAALVFATVCIVLTLICCVVVLEALPVRELGLSLALGPAELALVVVVVVPVALMATALQTLMSSFARSFKEAQTYISLLTFVPMIPGFLAMTGGLAGSTWQLMVPGLGQQLAIEQVMGAQMPSVLGFVLPTVSALLVAGICIVATTAMFRREAIVFGR